MTDLQAQWMKAVEDYYRDEYPRTMRAKIAEILPKSKPALSALYNTLIENVSAQYRTVPDLIAIRSAMREVIEGYPELSSPSVPLLQEAPIGTDVSEWFAAWAKAIAAGEDPRYSEGVREVLRKHGAEGVLDQAIEDEATTQQVV